MVRGAAARWNGRTNCRYSIEDPVAQDGATGFASATEEDRSLVAFSMSM